MPDDPADETETEAGAGGDPGPLRRVRPDIQPDMVELVSHAAVVGVIGQRVIFIERFHGFFLSSGVRRPHSR